MGKFNAFLCSMLPNRQATSIGDANLRLLQLQLLLALCLLLLLLLLLQRFGAAWKICRKKLPQKTENRKSGMLRCLYLSLSFSPAMSASLSLPLASLLFPCLAPSHLTRFCYSFVS